MLAVPLLLGVAASRPDPWQVVLAAAAVAGYLASATAQAWLRSRRGPSYVSSLIAYASTFAVLGIAVAVTHPAVLATAALIVPATLLALRGAKPRTRRDLLDSLAQALVALALVPAAALLGGPLDPGRVGPAVAVASVYLFGVVLVVRSVIRERDDTAFAGVSVGWHLGAAVLAAFLLPPAYTLVGLALAGRAAALPIMQRRRAGTGRPLRPVNVGVVEIVASTIVVVVAFLVPPAIR